MTQDFNNIDIRPSDLLSAFFRSEASLKEQFVCGMNGRIIDLQMQTKERQ